MRFEPRPSPSAWVSISAPLLAIAVALALAGILIAISGAPVLQAYGQIVLGALGSKLAVTETLTRATPLILTGLAAAVAFRARVYNIGAEGQLYLGALAVVAISQPVLGNLSPLLHVPVLLAAGAVAGMALLLLPLWLRLRFAVDEVVTTLLLNFVAILFVSMMIDGAMKDPLAFGWPQSIPVAEAGQLPVLIARSGVTLGLPIALVLALILHAVQQHTVFGLQSRAMGFNPKAATFAGVPALRTMMLVGCISGGLAGLAGAVEVMGSKGYVTTELSPGYGYSGIVVAMLANLNPLGVVGAALFTAVIFVGADAMSRSLGVPSFIADVTVALSLLGILVAAFFTRYRICK